MRVVDENITRNVPKSLYILAILGVFVAVVIGLYMMFVSALPVRAETVGVSVSEGARTGIISAEIQRVVQAGDTDDGSYRVIYRVKGAQGVSLYVDGIHQQTVAISKTHDWQTIVFDIKLSQYGSHTIRITATNGDVADDVATTYTIVYAKPSDQSELAISYDIVGGSHPLTDNPTIPNRPTFSGSAPQGTLIVVTVYSDPVSCQDIADKNNQWSCTLPTELPPGEHKVYIEATPVNGEAKSFGPFKVNVVDDGGSTATSDNESGWWVWLASGLGLVVIALVLVVIIRSKNQHTS